MATEARRAGCGRDQSLSPSPPYDITSGTRYRRAASVGDGGGGKTEAAQCRSRHSTLPDNRIIYANMERLFEVYRRYERSRSRQNPTWSPPLSSDDLERLLMAEIKCAGLRDTEDIRNGKKLQQRCRPETKSPTTHRESKTEGRSRTRNGQPACSKPSAASLQVAPKRLAALPSLSRKKTRPQRPEEVRTTAGTYSASSVWSNATHFTPPRSHSSRTSVTSKLSAAARRTQSTQPSCQSSTTTSRKFQTDSSIQTQSVSAQLPSVSATCDTEKQRKDIGDSSFRTSANTSKTAAVQSRSMSANQDRQRSIQASEMTICNTRIPPGFSHRGSGRLYGGAASQMTSAQRLSRCDLPKPRAAVAATRADATPTTRRYDGFGRGVSGCDAEGTPVRQRLLLRSSNRDKHPPTTADGVCIEHGISTSSKGQPTSSETRAVKSRQVAPESRLSKPRCTDVTAATESSINSVSSSNSWSSNSLKLTGLNCGKLPGSYSDCPRARRENAVASRLCPEDVEQMPRAQRRCGSHASHWKLLTETGYIHDLTKLQLKIQRNSSCL